MDKEESKKLGNDVAKAVGYDAQDDCPCFHGCAALFRLSRLC